MNKENQMEKSVTLRELVNYADAASYQAYCRSGAVGDFDSITLKWEEMKDAAEIIVADFFFNGNRNAAGEFIRKHGESKEFHVFIGNPNNFKDHPEIYDSIGNKNKVELCDEW